MREGDALVGAAAWGPGSASRPSRRAPPGVVRELRLYRRDFDAAARRVGLDDEGTQFLRSEVEARRERAMVKGRERATRGHVRKPVPTKCR